MEKHDLENKKGWPLSGNGRITDFLEKSIANGKIVNTYIFLGLKDLGKTAAAVHFAKSLLCQKKKPGAFSPPCGVCPSCRQMQNSGKEEKGFETLHGDFHLVRKEADKKNISIEQVREFIRILEMSSFLNSYKVGIIKDADDLSEGAANALLKTLEEPRQKVVVILTASRIEKIPATIVSRSQVLHFLPVPAATIYDYLIKDLGCPRAQAKNISRLSLGRPALAAKFFEDREFYQSYLLKTETFLQFFKDNLNQRLQAVGKISAGADEESKAETALGILNVWQGLLRDLILLNVNNGDLIQHEPWREKLEKISNGLNGGSLGKISDSLKLGEKYVRANVNPKLVLENIAINI
ncbi:MAG: DNA polymerase III subunit delta' [Patescibacteria group bacterium]|nr:DNA polymerase III subunit delta' [Patescibacteria group bacterium]